MQQLTKEEMKKVRGGVAAVICTYQLESNGCGNHQGNYFQLSCDDSLDACQDGADAYCLNSLQDSACCTDAECKYA